jgi:hypothetical protein
MCARESRLECKRNGSSPPNGWMGKGQILAQTGRSENGFDKKVKSQTLETEKALRLGVTHPKTRYCGHQSTRLSRGQVLWLVGGTDLYYKKEWGPREVHGDSLGTITDCLKVGKGV